MPLQQQELKASVQENFRENISLLRKHDYSLLNFIYLLTIITLAFCICLSFWKTCLLHCGTYCCFIMRFASIGNQTDFFFKLPAKEVFNLLRNKLNKNYNDLRNWDCSRTIDLFHKEKYTRK